VGFFFAENPLHTSQFAALLIESCLLLTHTLCFDTLLLQPCLIQLLLELGNTLLLWCGGLDDFTRSCTLYLHVCT